MAGWKDHGWRYALALLLLCVVTFGQSAALTGAHEQHRAQDHGCLVCYAGSLPFLESAIGATAPVPVLLRVWLKSPADIEATHEAGIAIRSSRAPPA
jgi:hypothetical protein